MNMAMNLTSQDFIELNNIPNGTTIFQFSPFCNHCAVVRPVLEKLKAQGHKVILLSSDNVTLDDLEYVPTAVCVGNDERQVGVGNFKRFVKECERKNGK